MKELLRQPSIPSIHPKPTLNLKPIPNLFEPSPIKPHTHSIVKPNAP